MDPDDQVPNVASQQSSSMFSSGTVMPNYSCLLPAPFDGTFDLEDFVTQFNSVVSLLIGKIIHQVICVLNSFLRAWVAML